MVMTYDETVSLEELKQKHRREIIRLESDREIESHKMRMQRLEKRLEIIKTGTKAFKLIEKIDGIFKEEE